MSATSNRPLLQPNQRRTARKVSRASSSPLSSSSRTPVSRSTSAITSSPLGASRMAEVANPVSCETPASSAITVESRTNETSVETAEGSDLAGGGEILNGRSSIFAGMRRHRGPAMARIDDQQVDRVRSDVENTKAHLHTVPGDARRLIGVAEVDLGFPRTWLEFTDPDDPARIFRCDTTRLTSRWQCIFGAGCPGIYADSPNVGCCALGAHFADDDDQQRVLGLVAELDADIWAHHGDAAADGRGAHRNSGRDRRGLRGPHPSRRRRLHLLQSAGLPGGPGCALHLLAQRRGWEPQQAKPEVCWQLPIRRDYDGASCPTVRRSRWC